MIDREIVRRIVELEREVDRLKTGGETPIWVDWTPTVGQGGAVSITVSSARYVLLGDIVVAQGYLGVTGAGVAGNGIIIGGQPAAIQSPTGAVVGSIRIQDTGTAQYVGVLYVVGATDWRILCHNEGDYCGADPNFALANGDAIWFHASYERA